MHIISRLYSSIYGVASTWQVIWPRMHFMTITIMSQWNDLNQYGVMCPLCECNRDVDFSRHNDSGIYGVASTWQVIWPRIHFMTITITSQWNDLNQCGVMCPLCECAGDMDFSKHNEKHKLVFLLIETWGVVTKELNSS